MKVFAGSIGMICLMLGAVLPSIASAQTECPSPTVPITDATRPLARANSIPDSATCWDPTDANTGKASGEAKEYLAQHASKSVNVACFNAEFAKHLADLMKAVPGGPPTITSGIRSKEDQEKARASGASKVGACDSYHQYGLAADFNTTPAKTLLWMRMNAPTYGLTRIPALSVQTGCSLKGTGFCDPAHIQIQGPLPSRNQCGVCAGSPYSGTLPDDPNVRNLDDSRFNTPGTPDYMPYAPPVNAPTFSSPLGMLSKPYAPISSLPTPSGVASNPTNPSTTQPPICSPEFSCTAGVMYYRTSTCTTQVYQVCSGACNGNSCAAATSTTGISSAFSTTTVTTTSTSTSSTPDTSNPQTSISDLITQLTGYNFKAVDIATSSSIAFSLDPATGDVASIGPGTPSQASQIPQTIYSVQPTSAPQTFTSQDLSSFDSGTYPAASNTVSGLQTILAGMASALRWALNVLRSL